MTLHKPCVSDHCREPYYETIKSGGHAGHLREIRCGRPSAFDVNVGGVRVSLCDGHLRQLADLINDILEPEASTDGKPELAAGPAPARDQARDHAGDVGGRGPEAEEAAAPAGGRGAPPEGEAARRPPGSLPVEARGPERGVPERPAADQGGSQGGAETAAKPPYRAVTDDEVRRRVTSGTTSRPDQVTVLYNDGRHALVKWPGSRQGSRPFASWVSPWVDLYDFTKTSDVWGGTKSGREVWNCAGDGHGRLTRKLVVVLVKSLGLDAACIRTP
jgi:hypothetical protein